MFCSAPTPRPVRLQLPLQGWHDLSTYKIVQRDLPAPQEVQHPEILDSVAVSVSIYVETSGTHSGGVQTLGRSKRKQAAVHQNQLDEVNDSHFNDCLCGSVVNPGSDRALMCKQVGCEMQWVLITSFQLWCHSLIHSII